MFPLKTGVNLFLQAYKKSEGNFFDREYQRLREILFSLFVCRALDILEKKEHFLLFHERQDMNDVSFITPSLTWAFKMQYFDVKEYTPRDPDNFDMFFQKIIKKSLNKDYNLIVWVHKNPQSGSIEKIKWNEVKKSVFIIFWADEKDESWFKSRVTLISKEIVQLDEIIDLSDLIAPEDPPLFYDDKINILL